MSVLVPQDRKLGCFVSCLHASIPYLISYPCLLKMSASALTSSVKMAWKCGEEDSEEEDTEDEEEAILVMMLCAAW